MPTTPKYLTRIAAPAFVLLLLGGLAASVMTLRKVPGTEWSSLANLQKILSGKATKEFTRQLNQRFVLGPTFSEIEHGILWNLTGDLGPRVRAGCGDWLFLVDELKIHPQRQQNAVFRAKVVARVDKLLQRRGIKLFVAVVPDKTRIERAHLCGLRRSALFGPRIEDWLQAVDAGGVHTLDLTATLHALPGDRYYHTDTHWNEAGANAGALAIANRLRGLQWAGASGDDKVVLNTHPVPRPGDLVHLAGLSGLPAFLRPATELASKTTVPPVASAGDDLFGDSSLPKVTLVGTSFSRNSNFAPFLEHHLGEQVANVAKDGGDFAGAATAYFASATFRDTPPRVVVWEIPERVIEMPLKDIEKEWLGQLKDGKL